ncbi:interferon-inducible GTPase-domain-containing protein [Suillus occidentalis]|nr:interferon-inducible GTPase-domain-containing protein [Suillus occidentalis]
MSSFRAVETFVDWLFGGDDDKNNAPRYQLARAAQELQEKQERLAEAKKKAEAAEADMHAAEERAEQSRRDAEEAKEGAKFSAAEAAEHERARRAAEEEAEKVRHAAAEAAEIARTRQEEYERAAAEAVEAKLKVERQWFEGVRPERLPSEGDVVRMKAEYCYSPGFFHLAVVGTSGGGKSSFINAVRNLSNSDPNPIAARTGIIECTDKVTRYPDPRPNSRIIWYDVPGAGTQNVPDWQYFNNLGLYIFDCIIVLIDNRFLESDLAILRTCEQFINVEAFIVRSKSDQHINNMVCDKMPGGFDPLDIDVDDETRGRLLQIRSEERRRFIDETRQNVQINLGSKNLSPKKVYIVCKDAVLKTWNNSGSLKGIDETELRNDIKECVHRRLQSGC